MKPRELLGKSGRIKAAKVSAVAGNWQPSKPRGLTRNGNEHGHCPLDVEEPSPGCMSECALHVGEDTGSDKSREGVGDEVTGEENGVSEGELSAGVPLFVSKIHL